MDLTVMQTLTGLTTCKLVNEKELIRVIPTSLTALISGTKEIFNLFPGTVLYYGTFKGEGTVNIAVSNHEVLRYLYLSEISEWPGSALQIGDRIGTSRADGILGLEYCTQWKGNSKQPVRILNRTYYKQNPIDILEGMYIPPKEINVEYGINRPNDVTNLTKEQSKEWSTYFTNDDAQIGQRNLSNKNKKSD